MKRSIISLAILAMTGITAIPSIAGPSNKAPTIDYSKVTTQLPRHVRPSHYDVSLIPNAKAGTFQGKVNIKIDVLKATDRITLNATDLKFNKVVLRNAKGKEIGGAAKIEVSALAQTATFTFDQTLPQGQYQLALDYDGVIGTQAVGLFSLDYDTAKGKQRALYTQFENSDARRVMPSWDEPVFKTTFTLDVTVPSNEMAVSNMPIVSSKALAGGLNHVQFAPSPKMSTYLLFLGVGDFERATVQAEGTEIGVIAKRGSLDQARFALDESKNVLKEYNDYFGVRFPLPKLDNVAAPGQSQFFSAMENWGAIFTFEGAMLIDPSISTQANKQAVFVTAAHEMAHQWFGDLVTMQWWDDLWLNEGFASWMENRAMRKLHPEWLPEFNAIGVREQAMGRDAIATSHPVVQHIETVEQASQAFDSITYQKGEAVIRMLENYVGENAWREGVRAYMKKHAYSNTVTKDFFTQIEKAAGKPISAIAKDFTQQAGVPLIKVEDIVCKNGKTTVSLSQGEFSKDLPNKKSLNWRVPVVAQIAAKGAENKIEGRTLVINGKGSLQLPACGTVVVNAGQNGYYRTLYAPKVFEQIASHFSSLNDIDQLGILSDSWAMGLAGQQAISDVLDVANAAPLEASAHVWGEISEVFSTISYYYRNDPVRQTAFNKFALKRLSPVMEKMGWTAKPGEPEYLSNFRASLIGIMSGLGDPATLMEARRRFSVMDTDPSAAPASLRLLILGIVANNADATTWDTLRARAQAEKSSLVRENLYLLLASTKDKALAQKALEMALTDEPGITTSASMIRTVAGEHPDMAFDFALAHVAQVNERVDATSRSRYFPGLGGGSSDPAMIDKLNAYAKAHLDQSARREVDTAIVNINYRIKLNKERLPAISAWLEKHM
ncbi:MAG: M1 family metallopeptidase [Undibacterium sp.]|nr:M1 family metallopeptidase [Undibacterium sp.]